MNLLLRAAFVLGAIFVGVNLLNYFVLGNSGDYLPGGQRMGEWKEAKIREACYPALESPERDSLLPKLSTNEHRVDWRDLNRAKAGSMQANVSAMLGKSDRWSENQTIELAASWGQLANCIYAQDDRELCDPDNRAAAVEATTKFFAYAKQADGSSGKPAISASDARVLEGFGDRLLIMLKNHRRYGTLVAADFGSFAPPEIMRIMREEQETRDICKR